MQNEDSRMQQRRNLWTWVRWLQFCSWRYSKKKPERQRITWYNREVFQQQKGNTISLQLWVSVTVLYIFCFRLLDVKRIIDSLCLCSFHFIMLIINIDEGVVKVMDSKRTPLGNWANMQECLQKAWKRFTANTRGVWKQELTFQPLNVSTTCQIRASLWF
jgi:hypothetical protein